MPHELGGPGTMGVADLLLGTGPVVQAVLWTLVLLIPVLFVNQGMVLRLGAVTGVGHARLILEKVGHHEHGQHAHSQRNLDHGPEHEADPGA